MRISHGGTCAGTMHIASRGAAACKQKQADTSAQGATWDALQVARSSAVVRPCTAGSGPLAPPASTPATSAAMAATWRMAATQNRSVAGPRGAFCVQAARCMNAHAKFASFALVAHARSCENALRQLSAGFHVLSTIKQSMSPRYSSNKQQTDCWHSGQARVPSARSVGTSVSACRCARAAASSARAPPHRSASSASVAGAASR